MNGGLFPKSYEVLLQHEREAMINRQMKLLDVRSNRRWHADADVGQFLELAASLAGQRKDG